MLDDPFEQDDQHYAWRALTKGARRRGNKFHIFFHGGAP